MSDKTSELMDEIKRAAVGDGKYAGLPSHVYSLFGDALAKLDEVAALEARLSKMEEARELALNAIERAQPTTHELDGAIVIWEVAWNELEEALAE